MTDTLNNFSGTTLTGGTYEVFGTMRWPTGTNIVTNAATILLDGAGSQLLRGCPQDYTQTAGMTTVNGTLTVPDRVDILGGSLFGNGTINGDVSRPRLEGDLLLA